MSFDTAREQDHEHLDNESLAQRSADRRIAAPSSGIMHGSMIWLVIPFSTMISWMYLVLEQVGESTENPFEGNPNDVPMAQVCRKIERELMDMLGEKSDVVEPGAEHGIVL